MTATPPAGANRLVLTKHHGLGNDFLVLVDPAGALVADGAVLAKQLCDRRRGIGADGLILAVPDAAAGLAGPAPSTPRPTSTCTVDAVMTLFNADGSRAEMSGNGIRCLAQALAMHRGTDHVDLVVGTDAGPRSLAVRPSPLDRATLDVRVGMGAVTAGPAWYRSADAAQALALVARPGGAPHVETADIGNPHLVIEVVDPWAVDVAAVGPRLEADFPAGINVHFIAPTPGQPDHLDLTVWERGAGVTEACGTGATAAAVVAHRWGLVGERVTVHMPGGVVEVDAGGPGGEAVLIGPATFIGRIEVDHG